VTIDDHEFLAERFEVNRTHLRAIAYRMLGSLSEANDAVQESGLRLARAHRGRSAVRRRWPPHSRVVPGSRNQRS
jgi:RNA polymerase sigma-70 factor (ECF subfamily)